MVFNYWTDTFDGELLLDPPEGELVWVSMKEALDLPMQDWFKERFPLFFEEGTYSSIPLNTKFETRNPVSSSTSRQAPSTKLSGKSTLPPGAKKPGKPRLDSKSVGCEKRATRSGENQEHDPVFVDVVLCLNL